MIIKFFNQGTTNSRNIISYLLSEEKHKSFKPEIVQGNAFLTNTITDSISRKYKYQTGVISFRENETLTVKQQLHLINEFVRTFCPFKEDDRTNFFWVRHMDKGRLELHFVFSMIDLKTKKQFNISPPGKANQMFYREFTAMKNFDFSFEQVDKRKYTIDDRKKSNIIVNDMIRNRIEFIVKRYDTVKIKFNKNKKGVKNGQRTINTNVNSKSNDINSVNRNTTTLNRTRLDNNQKQQLQQQSITDRRASFVSFKSIRFNEKSFITRPNRSNWNKTPLPQPSFKQGQDLTYIKIDIGNIDNQLSVLYLKRQSLSYMDRIEIDRKIAELNFQRDSLMRKYNELYYNNSNNIYSKKLFPK